MGSRNRPCGIWMYFIGVRPRFAETEHIKATFSGLHQEPENPVCLKAIGNLVVTVLGPHGQWAVTTPVVHEELEAVAPPPPALLIPGLRLFSWLSARFGVFLLFRRVPRQYPPGWASSFPRTTIFGFAVAVETRGGEVNAIIVRPGHPRHNESLEFVPLLHGGRPYGHLFFPDFSFLMRWVSGDNS